MEIHDIVREIRRDEDFIATRRGDVSGGEALWQSEMVAQLLAACKTEGMHTRWIPRVTPLGKNWRASSPSRICSLDVKHLDPVSTEGQPVSATNGFSIIWRRQQRKKSLDSHALIAGFNDSESIFNG